MFAPPHLSLQTPVALRLSQRQAEIAHQMRGGLPIKASNGTKTSVPR
jgi:hypothetical protein